MLDGLVVYTHKALSEGAATDRLTVRVSDGVSSTVGVVSVKISARDEETPRVVINRGLRVPPGEARAYSNLVL